MDYLARDIMNRDVIAVPSDMDLRDLGKLFLDKGITGAPVVDKDGTLAGVISQTDLIYYNLTRGDELTYDSHFYQSARMDTQHIQKGFQVEDFNSGVVADVMTPVVHSVAETAKVDSVSRLMTRKHIHRVIVRKGRKIAGIISAIDLLRHHARTSSGPAAGRRRTAAPAKKKATSTRKVARKVSRKVARKVTPAKKKKKAVTRRKRTV
jgi:CBS domain-containing protein